MEGDLIVSDPIKLTTAQQLFGNIDSSQTFSCFADLQAFNSLPPTNQTEETFVVNGRFTDFTDPNRRPQEKSKIVEPPQDTFVRFLGDKAHAGNAILTYIGSDHPEYITLDKIMTNNDDKIARKEKLDRSNTQELIKEQENTVKETYDKFMEHHQKHPERFVKKPPAKNPRPKYKQ